MREKEKDAHLCCHPPRLSALGMNYSRILKVTSAFNSNLTQHGHLHTERLRGAAVGAQGRAAGDREEKQIATFHSDVNRSPITNSSETAAGMYYLGRRRRQHAGSPENQK